MKFIYVFLMFLFFVQTMEAQGKLYRFCSDSVCGYKNKKGDVRVVSGRYVCAYPVLKRPVLLQSAGDESLWFMVDLGGRELCQIYVVDGSPDRYGKGLIRIVKDGMVGFADKKGRLVVPLKYNRAERFSGKYTVANVGAEPQGNSATDADASASWTGGKWGVLNRKGEVVLPFVYDREWNENLSCYQYVQDGNVFRLSEKGKVVWLRSK
ncbi:MAG: WG repeat-containing protein [Prevotellaceae bacterium]|nr:WG repeat-containing protein [Prevotellaceae bacterium]